MFQQLQARYSQLLQRVRPQGLSPADRWALGGAAAAAGLIWHFSQRARQQSRQRERARAVAAAAANAVNAAGGKAEAGAGGAAGSSDGRSAARAGKALAKKRVRAMMSMLWNATGSLSRKARIRLLLMAVLCILRTGVSDRLAQLQGGLFSAVFMRDKSNFLRMLVQTAAFDLALSGLTSSLSYLVDVVGLIYRRILSDRLHAKYFDNMTYYRVSFVDHRISNPEQRIVNDLPKFADAYSAIAESLLRGVIDGSYFTWQLSRQLGIFWALGGWTYVAGAVTLVQAFLPNIGKLVSGKQQLEGEFRQAFTHVNTHSEAIAAYDGEEREKQIVESRFDALCRHIAKMNSVMWTSGMLQDFMYKYFGATVAAVLIVAPFFSLITKTDRTLASTSVLLAKMRYVTSVVLNQMVAIGSLATVVVRISHMSGYGDRLGELFEVVNELHDTNKHGSGASSHALGGSGSRSESSRSEALPASSSGAPLTPRSVRASSHIRPGAFIAFDGVEVVTPTGNVLVKDLTFTVKPGVNLLLTGANGAGKSSLFRCLGGLWEVKKGVITKPGARSRSGSLQLSLVKQKKEEKKAGEDSDSEEEEKDEGLHGHVFYLPQKPYNVLGSLREQLTYPKTEAQLKAEGLAPPSDEQLLELLSLVDLAYLAQQHTGRNASRDTEVNWEETLSLGETQRLAMARLFYHRPTFAVLDECTSGVPSAMEDKLYRLCAERGITCITISHRPALEAYHNVKLSLDGKGSYTITEISKTAPLNRANSMHSVAMRLTVKDRSGVAATGKEQTSDGQLAEFKDGQDEVFPPLPSPLATLVRPIKTSLRARLSRLRRLLVPSLTHPNSVKLMMLSGVVVGRVALSNMIAHANGNTVKELLSNDLSGFSRLISVSIAQSAASAFLAPSLLYLSHGVALEWRKRLNRRLFTLYFKAKAFYKVSHLYTQYQQYEQRLTEDVDKLCSELADLFPDVIKPVVDIAWFTYVTQRLLGWRNTGLLYSYMVLGLGFLRVITPNFAKLTEKQQSLQGTLRYVYSRLRTHAESIAFFGGDHREGAIVQSKLDLLVGHLFHSMRLSWLYGIADDFVVKKLPNIVTWLLSYIYALKQSERGSMEATGQLAHDLRYVASAVSHTFLAFGELLSLNKRFQEVSGYLNRVAEVEELLQAICDQPEVTACSVPAAPAIPVPTNTSTTAMVPVPRGSTPPCTFVSDNIEFDNVDIVTPDGKCLARKVSLTVRPGSNMLVTGFTGAGKTALFRVLAGLWPLRAGRLGRPMSKADARALFFVPQRPYNVLGSFADLITYPVRASEVLADPAKEAQLRHFLEVVQVAYLLPREGGWNAVRNWADVLSLGEQQRIGMARLFFHKPLFAVLDQCTDAVSVDVEEKLYQYARELGITIITISQRPALMQLHDQALQLVDGQGGWELASIDH